MPIMQPSESLRIPCPHSNCPATFKSQHGRTYHIRSMHFNTHNRTTNVRSDSGRNAQEMGHHHSDDAVDTSDSESDAHSPDIERAGRMPEDDPGWPLVSQRIEHPHLNGMFAI